MDKKILGQGIKIASVLFGGIFTVALISKVLKELMAHPILIVLVVLSVIVFLIGRALAKGKI